MTTYCLVDASNMMWRARYATSQKKAGPGGPLTPEELVSLGLMTTFMSMRKVHDKFNANHVVVCFDRSSWRKNFFSGYKESRKVDEDATEEDRLVYELTWRAIDSLRTFLHEHTNTTVLCADGCEADDFIAHWIRMHPADHHVIVSTDSDYKQLVSNNVDLYTPINQTLYRIDGIYFQDNRRPEKGEPVEMIYSETWKIKLDKSKNPEMIDPEWELFYKVMMGDSSDDVPRASPKGKGDAAIRALYEARSTSAFDSFMAMPRDDLPRGDGGQMIYVQDIAERNVVLVDLSAQPDEIKLILETSIIQELARDKRGRVGVPFIQFCREHRLIRIAEQADHITPMLAKSYKGHLVGGP